MVVIGKKGQGKSSLCNSLLYRDSDKDEFKVSTDQYNTTKTQVLKGTLMADGKRNIRVVDTPGPCKNSEAEAEADVLIDMVDCLQKEVKRVNRFLFAISIEEPRLDKTIYDTLKKF